MKRFDKIFIIAILSILGTSVFGQSGLNVKDYTGRLQERRTFEPTKIAVEEARYVGIEYITASDSVIIRNCGIILQNDLDFSPYFPLILKMYRSIPFLCATWKWIA